MAERDDVILVTGAAGQVGSESVHVLGRLGRIVALTRAELDLANPAAIRDIVRRVRPRAIVNAAAYNAVDRAESERELCAAVNRDAPGILAEEARRLGAFLVHYSTDYVFNGDKRTPYVETDPPAPLSVYAATKLAGEEAVASSGCDSVTLRTSWVYGSRGTNFVRAVLRLARERSELRMVNDQVGTPTWSRSVARATAYILEQALIGRGALESHFGGLYHLTAAGSTTRYEFARAIIEGDPRRGEQVCRAVIPISTEDFGAVATRPAYSVLDSTKFTKRFGIALPDWREQLKLVLAELA